MRQKPVCKSSLIAAIEEQLLKITCDDHVKEKLPSGFRIPRVLFATNKISPEPLVVLPLKVFLAPRAMVLHVSIVCCKITARSLTDLNYVVDIFTCGLKALEHLRLTKHNISYDVIVTDLDMPSLDDVHFVHVYRQLYSLTTAVVVISSAHRMGEEAIRLGADSFMEKPSSREKIIGVFSSLKN